MLLLHAAPVPPLLPVPSAPSRAADKTAAVPFVLGSLTQALNPGESVHPQTPRKDQDLATIYKFQQDATKFQKEVTDAW